MKRLSKIKKWPIWKLACGAFLLFVCVVFASRFFREKKPLSNSEAYVAAHGIVVGRVNELRVSGVLLRFPARYMPNPHTGGEIVRGQADTVSVNLDIGRPFDADAPNMPPPSAPVSVEISRYGVEDIERNRRRLAVKWRSITDIPSLGLRQYISVMNDGGWGYRVYTPLDSSATTLKGGLIIYVCSGPPDSDPVQCRTQYQHPQGLIIQYYLNGKLLPHWHDVHRRVLRAVDSFFYNRNE